MKKTLVLLVAVAVGPIALAGQSAAAGSGFTFHGSGYGHGIGMSQYGALGLARKGWSASKILRHYYTGVRVGRRKPPEPSIRVGLLQDRGSVSLEAVQGSFDLVLQSGALVDTVDAGSRRRVEVTAENQYRVLRPDGSVVGDHAWGSATDHLVARRKSGRIRVVEWGHGIGHGELRFEISDPGAAHLLAVMPVEEYIKGVSEVPSSWARAALLAQAVAARTYAYWRLEGALRAGCNCDVVGTTADQNYVGWDKEAAPGGARWVRAVRDSRRKVLTHDGGFIYSAYGSSSGGYTENIEKVWPAADPLPYLRGVCDPGDFVEDNPNRTWQAAFDVGTLTNELLAYTGDIGTVTGFADFERGVSGRVTHVRVMGTQGNVMLEGWDVRTGLALKDTRFAVNENLNVTGSIRLAYDRIRCKPGRAVTPQQPVPGGRWQGFNKGRMYLNGGRDSVVWLRGAVLARYMELGAHDSKLRLPYRYRNVNGGAKAWFDGGTIACTPGCSVSYS